MITTPSGIARRLPTARQQPSVGLLHRFPASRVLRCVVRASATAQAVPSSVTDPLAVKQGTPLQAAHLKPKYDAIVIGSGMGGLTAAVGLAKFGAKEVLVLEQHYTAGGFTHAFKRGRFAWNVGVHYIGGGVGERGGDLFAPLNAFTDGQVAWAKLPYVHDRVVIGDRVYDCVTGEQEWLDKMTEYFPREQQALLQFLRLGEAAGKGLRGCRTAYTLPGWLSFAKPFLVRSWADLAGRRLSDVLDTLTQDKELQAVLAASWPDVGCTPKRCSAGYYLNAYRRYINGAFIPVGGANSIAAAMIPTIESAGGAVVTSADVTEIVVKDGRAVGVRLADGHEISADVVISNAGLHNTYLRLLPPEVTALPALQRQLHQATAAGYSLSAAVLYLGLNEALLPEFQGLGTLRLYNSTDYDGDLDRFMAQPDTLPMAEICCCDAREQIIPDTPAGVAAAAQEHVARAAGAGGVSTLQVLTFANYDWFKDWADTRWHQRGEEYESFKHKLEDMLMQKLGSVFPDLPGRVAVKELSTPLSTEHFSRWPRGGIYGIRASPERYQLTGGLSWGPATPLPGLLLTGQDVVGDGVMAAFMAGTLAAQVAGGGKVGLGMMKEIKKWQ